MTQSALKRPKLLSRSKKISMANQVLERLKKQLPEPKCELFHYTPFQLLISVVLSAQTTDKMVNRCMEPVYQKQPEFGPQHVLKMGQEGFLKVIRSIGLAPTKSANVYKLSEIILEKHAGAVPGSRKDLESLPGVGRKTANVVLAEVFGQPTLAVDTHVFRVGLRLALHREASPLKAEKALLDVIDDSWLPAAHHWLILHGRYTCKSQRPLCDSCTIRDICPSLV